MISFPIHVSVFLFVTYIDITTSEGNCTHGDVRLNGVYDEVTMRKNGTVEVCVNNAWGTVCSVASFDDIDAEAVCHQIPGFSREGKLLVIT